MRLHRFNFQWSIAHTAAGLATAALALTMIALSPSAARAGETQDVAYVQNLARLVTTIVNDTSLSAGQKAGKLGTVIATNLDLDRIAKFTLGKYRRTASPAEMSKFISVFRQYALGIYGTRLSQFQGNAEFKVTGAQVLPNGQGTFVRSTVSTSDQPQPYNLDWRVADIDNKPVIIDVRIEDVWMAQNLRTQFVKVMDDNGGKVSALINQLKASLTEGTAPKEAAAQHS